MATPNTSYHDPGPYNVFIPAATSQLHVEFSRNPDDFPLNRYMQIIPNQEISGLYAEMSTTDPITIVDEAESIWPEGQERPAGEKRPFRWRQWRAERKTFGYTLGSLTVKQARFDVVAAHGRGSAAKCMTDRTLDAQTVLSTAGNWPSPNTVASIDALLGTTGAGWTIALLTTANQFLKRSINAVLQTILQQTGGVIGPSSLVLVINPVMAGILSASAEVREWMVNHRDATAALQGTDRRIVDTYSLPPNIYGVEIVVEDAVRQTTHRNMDGSGTVGFLMADNDAMFVSRVGGLIGAGAVDGNAAPTFTTLTGFFEEEMSVETETDGWNRLVKGGVTDTRDIVITAGASGLFIQDTAT